MAISAGNSTMAPTNGSDPDSSRPSTPSTTDTTTSTASNRTPTATHCICWRRTPEERR